MNGVDFEPKCPKCGATQLTVADNKVNKMTVTFVMCEQCKTVVGVLPSKRYLQRTLGLNDD